MMKHVMQAKQHIRIRSKVGKRDLIKNMYVCVILCLYSWNVLRQPQKSTQTLWNIQKESAFWISIFQLFKSIKSIGSSPTIRHRQEALNGVVTRLGVRSIADVLFSAAVAASAAAAAAAVVAAPECCGIRMRLRDKGTMMVPYPSYKLWE